MRTLFFKKFFDFSIFSLVILLAFLLLFERYLEIPVLVSWLGHWHPLVIHFPIVLILVTIIQYWRKDPNISFYLSITTVLTLVSAITGFLLSLEGGSKGQLVLTHQWMGVSVSYLLSAWYWVSLNPGLPKVYYKIIHGGLVVLIVLTGHFGGMITHGKDFLAFGKGDNSMDVSIPDDPQVFEHIVQPILNKRCASCHNENKAKGELLLTDFSSLMKGGESGPIIDQGDFSNSELVKRILMPVEKEDHMPPEEEDQLSELELITLKAWVELGAENGLMYNQLDEASPLYSIVSDKIKERQLNKWEHLPTVSDEKISELASDFCNILRIHNNCNALQVLIFPHKEYSPTLLQNLKPIAKNIIELNVSNLPLGEQEMKTIGSFSNIEKLNMSGTTLNDEIFQYLGVLNKLENLKVYDTKLGAGAMAQLHTFPGLTDLYVYNTAIEDRDIKTLKEQREGIHVVKIAEEALDFKSVLPPPTIEPGKYFFREPFYAKLEHPLAEINFNYTVDGSNPDVDSPNIMDSVLIKESFKMKYFASKDGWVSSAIDSASFLKTGQEPINYTLEHSPDPKYVGRGKSLLFDLEKGPVNFGDSAWMAFRDDFFILTCEFDQEVTFNNIVLSSMIHTDPHLFPPSSIRIFGGLYKNKMNVLGSLKPEQPKDRLNQHFRYYDCKVKPTPIKYIKIIVKPLQKIPAWHQEKGEIGWFFIDEVVFQEKIYESIL